MLVIFGIKNKNFFSYGKIAQNIRLTFAVNKMKAVKGATHKIQAEFTYQYTRSAVTQHHGIVADGFVV